MKGASGRSSADGRVLATGGAIGLEGELPAAFVDEVVVFSFAERQQVVEVGGSLVFPVGMTWWMRQASNGMFQAGNPHV